MKHFFSLLFILFVASCSQKSVIEYPDYELGNDFLSVYSIERTDTATILRGNVYNRPNYWVSITSGTVLKSRDTEKVYKLLSSPDYEIDKEIYMPENGTLPFTLFFEPVDKTDVTVDFIEDDRTVIKGLSLKERTGKYHTKISGTVLDRPQSSRIALALIGTDLRIGKWLSVPIVDGTFNYELVSDKQEPYEIIFWDEYINGAWRSFDFFSDNDVLNITCNFKDEYQRYTSESSSAINKELNRYLKEVDTKFDYKPLNEESDKLRESNAYYTSAMQQLLEEAQAESDYDKKDKLYAEINRKINAGEGLTPEAEAIDKKYKELSRLGKEFTMEYIKQDNPGLAQYFRLADIIRWGRDPEKLQPYIDIYNEKYASLFPDNILTEQIQLKIGSTKLQDGGKYIDFTAPDLQQKDHTLSDLIQDKVAIINLWASWCGPCRRHGIELIPIYNEYKDKGFTVVGIARENNNTRAMEKAIEQDKYPWINLVELNDKSQIWQKYGAGNGGGIIVMVNKEGTVIAVNPTVEEVKQKLQQYL